MKETDTIQPLGFKQRLYTLIYENVVIHKGNSRTILGTFDSKEKMLTRIKNHLKMFAIKYHQYKYDSQLRNVAESWLEKINEADENIKTYEKLLCQILDSKFSSEIHEYEVLEHELNENIEK